MLHVIISPAKQMRVARDSFSPRGIPPFPDATERLYQALLAIERAHGTDGLKELWRVNDKLLAQNVERLHAFVPVRDAAQLEEPGIARAVSPAAFSYIGIQYQSLAPEVLDLDALAWLEEHLWILSGFYGCVRPFDAVEPYRLEMGAKLAVEGARDLYAFWGDRIARAIEGDAAGMRDTTLEPAVIVNLASVEYAKAVLPSHGAHHAGRHLHLRRRAARRQARAARHGEQDRPRLHGALDGGAAHRACPRPRSVRRRLPPRPRIRPRTQAQDGRDGADAHLYTRRQRGVSAPGRVRASNPNGIGMRPSSGLTRPPAT